MKELLSELNAVASAVSATLEADSFPSTIEPQSLREAVRSYPLRGGKRLRPALTLWACGALGADPMKALKAGAAIEIYHNWTLVHDDIIDHDDLRRGAPTTHKELEGKGIASLGLKKPEAVEYGRNFAILAGDVQQAWATDMLLRTNEDGIPPALSLALARRLCESVNRELISGEALDVEFPYWRKSLPTEEQVLRMISWKTGTLLKFCMQAGGAIALGSSDFEQRMELRKLGEFAEKLGIAFQLIDDHLGVFGELSEFGKPLCSDFREGKPTILYLKALAGLKAKQKAELKKLVGLDRYKPAQIEAVRGLLREAGAEKANLDLAEKLSTESMAALSFLPASKFKELLLSLARQLLSRKA